MLIGIDLVEKLVWKFCGRQSSVCVREGSNTLYVDLTGRSRGKTGVVWNSDAGGGWHVGGSDDR